MVKREQITPGQAVKVNRLMSGPPGPSFIGKVSIGDVMVICGPISKVGGLNLVRVGVNKTMQNVYYAFITNFCSLV